MSLNIIVLCPKYWRKVLMGFCDVSPIISDKNPCKVFQITHKTMALPILEIENKRNTSIEKVCFNYTSEF